MNKKNWITIVLGLVLMTGLVKAQGLVVDHTAVNQFENIPEEWIITVKNNFWLYYQHTSHGSQIVKGADRIETALYRLVRAEEVLPNVAGALNMYEDEHPRECNFWADTDTNIPGLNKYAKINIAIWSWCCELNSAGTSINRYFSGMKANEEAYPGVTFIYMTGNAQSWHGNHTYKSDEDGYNRYLKNEQIRQYCRMNNKILFDFADIDCWYNGEKATTTYNGNIFPHEHPHYNLNEGGHTSYENCENKAKAFWYMLARIAGWGGQVTPPSPPIDNLVIDLLMADPEVRIAQKIYCHLENVLATDQLQATLDNEIIYQKNGNLKSEEVFVADYRNLNQGLHQLAVKVVNNIGQIRKIVTREWRTLHDGMPEVGIDENNSIRINGELFFPIYPQLDTYYFIDWIQNGYVNAGAKTTYLPGHEHADYTLAEYRDWLDICVSQGVKNIGPATRWEGIGFNPSNVPNGKGNDLSKMTAYVTTLKEHSGVMMWQWSDEPDGGGSTNRVEPDEIRRWTDLCHQYDTNHPHAVNLTAYYWARDGNHYVNHCKDYSFLYNAGWFGGENKVIADVIGFDFYPIEYATKNWNPPASFESMCKALDRIREYNYDLVPIFSWIESCDIHPDRDGDGYADGPGGDYLWTPAPTAEEMWAELWLKIIHGVKGIKGHPYNAAECKADPPYNWEIMRKFKTWVDNLKGAVLGPEYTESQITDIEQNGGQIDWMAKKYNDKIYIFACNMFNQSEAVKFTAPVTADDVIQVYGENRTIEARNGNFSDNFAGLELHIYIIGGNGGGDIEPPAPPQGTMIMQIKIDK